MGLKDRCFQNTCHNNLAEPDLAVEKPAIVMLTKSNLQFSVQTCGIFLMQAGLFIHFIYICKLCWQDNKPGII